MATDNATKMAVVLSRFRVATEELAIVTRKHESRRDAAVTFARVYQTSRERYQHEVWAKQGKRLCPVCGKVRGAKTFRWAVFFFSRSMKRIKYACRSCWSGGMGKLLMLDGEDLFYQDGAHAASIHDKGVTTHPTPLRWNDERFTVGEDMPLP